MLRFNSYYQPTLENPTTFGKRTDDFLNYPSHSRANNISMYQQGSYPSTTTSVQPGPSMLARPAVAGHILKTIQTSGAQVPRSNISRLGRATVANTIDYDGGAGDAGEDLESHVIFANAAKGSRVQSLN
jgi:hypothetical protein